MQVREKVEKSRNVVFFQWFVAPEGRRVGSLKRRVRSHLARCEINHCTPLWREARFQVKRAKNWQVRSTFGRSDVVSRGRRKGLCTLSKISKTWSFVAFPSTMAGVGHLKRICKDAFSIIFRGRRSARDMFIRDVRRSGRWFPWEGCILEQIVSFGRWFCVTGAALCMTRHHFFVAGAILQRHGLEKSQNAVVRDRQLCTQLSIIKVSQNCFVFDVANFKHGGSLAELLRFDVANFKIWGSVAELLPFWRYQVQKLRKSRRMASFSNLQTDRSIDRWMDGWIDRRLQLQLQLQLPYHYNYKYICKYAML